MLEYLDAAVVNALRQIVGGFGFVFVLAFLMWKFSQRRRGMGGRVLEIHTLILLRPV